MPLALEVGMLAVMGCCRQMDQQLRPRYQQLAMLLSGIPLGIGVYILESSLTLPKET